jgi:hypothetical protein
VKRIGGKNGRRKWAFKTVEQEPGETIAYLDPSRQLQSQNQVELLIGEDNQIA